MLYRLVFVNVLVIFLAAQFIFWKNLSSDQKRLSKARKYNMFQWTLSPFQRLAQLIRDITGIFILGFAFNELMKLLGV